MICNGCQTTGTPRVIERKVLTPEGKPAVKRFENPPEDWAIRAAAGRVLKFCAACIPRVTSGELVIDAAGAVATKPEPELE